MNKKNKLICGGILIALAVIAFALYSQRETILIKAGNFMAPTGDYSADVVILEGMNDITDGFIDTGMALLSSGKVKKIIIILHRIELQDQPFAFGDNSDATRKRLKNLGLSDEQFKIIVTPMRNPITLNKAKTVLENLAQDHIKSAILLSPSFHTRRSYLAFQYIGEPLQIKIYPMACCTDHLGKWWTNKIALRKFVDQSLKLLYYLACGYIPLKLSY